MMADRPQITVIGTSRPSNDLKEKAFEVGYLLGEEDVVLICGGGPGVMEEACRGLREASGGLAIGIMKETTAEKANPYLDVVIPTGMGHARNLTNILAGQAVIAVGGRYGTLSEISFACIHDRPIFGVDTWEHPDFDFLSDLTPGQAVEKVLGAMNEKLD